ncbi:hypothetical protein LAD67_16200 [Escherichia coli]|nr:hypothetical protein [Escherichia coli]
MCEKYKVEAVMIKQIDKIKLKSSLHKENKGIDREWGAFRGEKRAMPIITIMALLDIQQKLRRRFRLFLFYRCVVDS